ncbi:MAG: hypothetical protein KAU48_03105 [Candidatus Thorarchaeota archaeon]|nr:hypothetical protein [Candidatus Thorarchaeota archaeon]
MTNKQKALKRERVRLRKSQNPQQVDYRKIDRLRAARTEFWKIKKRSGKAEEKTISKVDTKKAKPEKEKKKKVKEPELEVIEDKPELEAIEEKPELEVIEEEPEEEEISKELEELYSDDDDVLEDKETEEEEVTETSE